MKPAWFGEISLETKVRQLHAFDEDKIRTPRNPSGKKKEMVNGKT